MEGTPADPLVVIWVSLIVSEAPGSVVADAVDETRIKNKIRTADAKATEYDFLLIFTYPTP